MTSADPHAATRWEYHFVYKRRRCVMCPMFTVLLTAAALLVCSLREDTPAARPLRRIRADLRATGWRRLAWLATCVLLGGMAVALVAALRTGLYGAALAVAALACAAASCASLDRRPVRVRRLVVR